MQDVKGQAKILRDLDAYAIQQYQQNRYPCFFVDSITEAVPGEYARGFKNFTYNEWFFPAHFEDEPNVPGFVQIETLTQVFLMTFLTLPEYKGKKTGFISIKDARFRKKIVPGDRLDINAELKSFRRGLARGVSKGYVNGELCCSLELEVAIPDIMTQFLPQARKEPRGGGGNPASTIAPLFHPGRYGCLLRKAEDPIRWMLYFNARGDRYAA